MIEAVMLCCDEFCVCSVKMDQGCARYYRVGDGT